MDSFNFKRAKVNIPKKNKKKIHKYIPKNSNLLETEYKYINNNLSNTELELINLYWNDYYTNYLIKSKNLADMLKKQEEFRKINKDWISFYNYKK